jgi:Uncharacterized protein conserved in bacteria (DUF2252)
MDVREATVRYEKWMATHIKVVNRDLQYKHKQMSESSFAFMRATFYRWLQIWKDLCRVEAEAPRLLAVGDLHIENFGTWRDAEGRLIWGVNDFDECHSLPYTNDLVRLATSALLAIESEHLMIRRREACDAILDGYLQGMRSGGRPFVLGEEHVFLRDIALSKLRDPVHFWARMRELPDSRQKPSADVAEALELLLPEAKIPYRIKARRAGLGSLGRLRLVALAEWGGGPVAREAKAALPSACVWAEHESNSRVWYSEIIARAVRIPDPFVKLHGNWIVRRLAPDCSRIELWSLPEKRDEAKLLFAMGYEAANIHLGTAEMAKKVWRDLKQRPAWWLYEASKKMEAKIANDWHEWRRSVGHSQSQSRLE